MHISLSHCAIACVYGDPHIITLDGHKYTFNGKGEFVLIEMEDESFTLQARMVPVNSSSGNTSLATVFTAIVAKQLDSDMAQFEIAENGTMVLVNGDQIDFSAIKEQEFSNLTITDLGNSSYSASFSSGAYVEVKEENGIFSVLIVSLPNGFEGGQSHGLMGSFNGNTSDDLLPKLSLEPLHLNSSLQEIHELFGVTCKYRACNLHVFLLCLLHGIWLFLTFIITRFGSTAVKCINNSYLTILYALGI